MRVCCLVALGLAARAVAAPVEVGCLPTWDFADTEVSTNVPFAFSLENVKHLKLALELAGTPSNNVQVAFGRDANTNGVLEVDETGLLVGWDCGRWKVKKGWRRSEGLRGGGWTASEMTTNRVKRLDFDLGVLAGKSIRLTSAENGVPLDWTMMRVPRDLFDRDWDTLRLTVRGVDVADESLRAQLQVAGMLIWVR